MIWLLAIGRPLPCLPLRRAQFQVFQRYKSFARKRQNGGKAAMKSVDIQEPRRRSTKALHDPEKYARVHSHPLTKGIEYMELKCALPEVSARPSTISKGQLQSLDDIFQMPLDLRLSKNVQYIRRHVDFWSNAFRYMGCSLPRVEEISEMSDADLVLYYGTVRRVEEVSYLEYGVDCQKFGPKVVDVGLSGPSQSPVERPRRLE
jgi:hypothetical protein